MDTGEIERLIATISWSHIPAFVTTKDGTELSLLLRPPTQMEQAKSTIIYNTEYQKSLILGLSCEYATIQELIELGQWSDQKESEITGLQDDIYKIRLGLLDFLFDRTKLEKTRSLLRRAEVALVERLSQRQELTQNSAEAHALICQQRYLTSCITETENNNAFWHKKEDFEEFSDIGLITQLCDIFFRKSKLSSKIIREIARSQTWRVYWEIAKNTGDLFGTIISLWSSNQRELVYWSGVYDSVYGAYERPSSDIISDNDLLDSWFMRQSKKTDKTSQSNTIGGQTKPGRNEQFIMADREGAKRVYDMNDPGTRAKIRARQRVLQKHGSVKEQDMPDSQQEMRQQLAAMQKKTIKDISRR